MPDVILNLLPVREEEKAAFEAAAPDAVHLYAGRRTATPEQFAQATIVMGWPRAEMLAQAPRLRWFHCMWAGTDQYTDTVPALSADDLLRRHQQPVCGGAHAGQPAVPVSENPPVPGPAARSQLDRRGRYEVPGRGHSAGGGRGPCGLRLRPAVQGPGGRAHHRAEADGGRPGPRL